MLLYCARCGTGFNTAAAAAPTACPRCRARDGVFSPLTFWLFDSPPADQRPNGPHLEPPIKQREEA